MQRVQPKSVIPGLLQEMLQISEEKTISAMKTGTRDLSRDLTQESIRRSRTQEKAPRLGDGRGRMKAAVTPRGRWRACSRRRSGNKRQRERVSAGTHATREPRATFGKLTVATRCTETPRVYAPKVCNHASRGARTREFIFAP